MNWNRGNMVLYIPKEYRKYVEEMEKSAHEAKLPTGAVLGKILKTFIEKNIEIEI